MSSENDPGADPSAALSAWLQMTTDFWGQMARSMPFAADGNPADTESSPGGESSRMNEAWHGTLNTLRFLATLANDPGTFDTLNKGLGTLPEMAAKMTASGWSALFELQQQWLKKAGKVSASSQARPFEDYDQAALRIFSEIYEKEFSKYLHIPPVGLTRFYQERLGVAMDKYTRFQTVMAEFMQVLYIPVEKSIKRLQEQLTELAEKGELPENPKAYYQQWIKILEGHYMTLFKSPEYVQSMGKTLAALEEFSAAKKDVFEDLLQSVPVPTDKDMDELYAEIYRLKKRVKALERGKG